MHAPLKLCMVLTHGPRHFFVRVHVSCCSCLCIATDPSLIPSSFSQHIPSSSQLHSSSSQRCPSTTRYSPEPGPAKTSNPLSLPSPDPSRQSVLSVKVPPDSNTANQKRPAEEKPVASAPLLQKMKLSDKQEMSAPKGGTTIDPWSDENYWKSCDDGNRSPYFWERTFMNEPEEDTKKEQDSNCKTQ